MTAALLGGLVITVACGNALVGEESIGRENWEQPHNGGAAVPTGDRADVPSETAAPWVRIEPQQMLLAVDTHEGQLGGFELTLVFEPAELELVAILRVNDMLDLLYDRGQFASGRVRLLGFQTAEVGPSGRFALARLDFRARVPTGRDGLLAGETPSLSLDDAHAYSPVPDPRDIAVSFWLKEDPDWRPY